VAAAIDDAGFALDFRVPGAGRVTAWEPPAAAGHLAERYRHLIIIALGELVLVSAQTFSGRGFAPDRTAAFLVEIATAALLLRIYIYRSGRLLSAAAATVGSSGRPSRWLGYVHLVMVAGIIATSVGAELVIAEPVGRTAPSPWDLAILGGPALFMVGRAGFEYAVFTRVSLDRPIGVLVLAVLIPVALLPLSPLLTGTTAMTVLAAIALADAARAWHRPRRGWWPRPVERTEGDG
jgi:low temperature requirement protein LtrA